MINIGRHQNLSESDYNAIDALRNSDIKYLLRSPAHYKYPPRPKGERRDILLGKVVHTLVLTPERFEDQFILPTTEKKPRKGSKAYDALQDFAGSREIIAQDVYDQARYMRDALYAEPDVAKILAKFDAEVSYVAEIDLEDGIKVPLKARLDIENSPVPGWDFDLKTISSIAKWEAHAEDFGYNTQQYHHPYVKSLALNQPVRRLGFILIEPEPPYVVELVWPDDRAVMKGAKDCNAAYEIYGDCRKTGVWPKKPMVKRVYGLPKWVKVDEDN